MTKSKFLSSRVAPIKTTTIPKLELQAVLHASRITISFIEEHYFTMNQVFLWSDSSTVMQWLNAFEKKQQIFVANRIGEILENTKLGEWNHIPGAQNPAHLGTRGMSANEVASSMWLNGPAWLSENEAHWPKAVPACTIVEETSETSQVVTLLTSKPLEIQWERFSSWTRLFSFYLLQTTLEKVQSSKRTNFIGRISLCTANHFQIGSKGVFYD